MIRFLFATNNQHKLSEAREILPDYEILSLSDMNIHIDIPEDFETLEENALQKAQFIFDLTGMNVIADDTGLEIEALDGRPGVYSARYAGEHCTFEDNVKKILHELEGIDNRKAAFRTVVAMILNGETHVFEGRVDGKIAHIAYGEKGFGYDPVFYPEGYTETFAQMPAELKNAMSHRGRALRQFAEFFKKSNQTSAKTK